MLTFVSTNSFMLTLQIQRLRIKKCTLFTLAKFYMLITQIFYNCGNSWLMNWRLNHKYGCMKLHQICLKHGYTYIFFCSSDQRSKIFFQNLVDTQICFWISQFASSLLFSLNILCWNFYVWNISIHNIFLHYIHFFLVYMCVYT